jgi:drug/metabolite transporter (DMT)-like permease
MNYLGEIFALAAPLSWSIAVILFHSTGRVVPPLALNFFKNSVALVLFVLTMMVVGEPILRSHPASLYLLLVVSGVIGIGISDTLFFMTLNRVGAGMQAIINTSYSPSIILLSFLFLHERLRPLQLLGVAFILSAVLSLAWPTKGIEPLPRRTVIVGILLGLGTTLTQAVSIVMVKPQLAELPLLWANFWRLAGGLLTSILLFGFLPGMRAGLRSLKKVSIWPSMIPGTVMGTYVSLLFWLGGMKYTLASTAAALNQTATLWTFVLAVLLLREPVTRGRLIGLLGGLAGVALVTFG